MKTISFTAGFTIGWPMTENMLKVTLIEPKSKLIIKDLSGKRLVTIKHYNIIQV